ncbi:hypothetical protein [Microcoleus sp. Pol12A5]|uniref:hypothetical protein n=1 Tax=Microcoleus sp. Pol12A5 TaxID=3055392 RepID=UPI002FD205F5
MVMVDDEAIAPGVWRRWWRWRVACLWWVWWRVRGGFGLWVWIVDGGGGGARRVRFIRSPLRTIHPQHQHPECSRSPLRKLLNGWLIKCFRCS